MLSLQHVGLSLLVPLEAMHREGMIHRDVKPANYAIYPPGASGTEGEQPALFLAAGGAGGEPMRRAGLGWAGLGWAGLGWGPCSWQQHDAGRQLGD